MSRVILFLTLLALAVTAAAETMRLSKPVEVSDTYEVFGAPMSDKERGLRLKDVIAREGEFDGREVRVTTRVAKVCQKKGCFFIATDGAASARVTFADYGFFVPTDSSGKDVTLVGTFAKVELDQAQAEHYAADLGEAEPEQASAGPEYAIVATSVLIPRG